MEFNNLHELFEASMQQFTYRYL